ncbi:hypothetical protein GCM10010191_19440 [Actinomadura vinacea]|uniref:Uncharacterized protein n=1 Tax=Actinomadura vinacea TaxID=115336 RepID=A0ABN3IQ22_9ACTN
MAIDQLAGELMDVLFDAYPGDARLLGVRDHADRPTDHTEATGPAHGARQAVDFMVEHTATNRVEIEAPAYMVGRMEIQHIRAAVAAPLDETFHDVVPDTGPLPMEVLDEVVQAWAGGQP